MKTRTCKQLSERAYALMIVMTFLGLSLLVLTALMTWTSQSVRNTDRLSEYYTSASAAEAATEKVLVHLSHDYLLGGDPTVASNLSTYNQYVPLSTENTNWANYNFQNPGDGTPGTYIVNTSAKSFVQLTGQYAGLFGFQSTYYMSSDATLNSSRYGITARVGQWIGLDAIPLFQFAIFYNMDLEIEPSPPMVVNGRVHSNSNIFMLPSTSLTFSNNVTAVGYIVTNTMPGDKHVSVSNPDVIYGTNATALSYQNSLNMPIGTNNSPDNVFKVLEIPPAIEDPNSPMGRSRFYNEADLIVVVSNNAVSVTTGITNGQAVITTNEWMQFLNTNDVFYNGREGVNVRPVQLDVSNLVVWAKSSGNSNHINPRIVYIADLRTNAGTGFETGVRLVDGAELPTTGFTVASPNPVYIQGDYNVKDATGSSLAVNDTTHTYPAAVLGDAITILSDKWQDSQNTKADGNNHPASDTTVNAAFLTGIVPTTSQSYSGGVENFPRFLEQWGTNVNFWYNGSMVAMFNSRTADGPWRSGTTYYTPPARKWAFDVNFYNKDKLPPGTPWIPAVQRLQWAFRERKPGSP